MYCYPASSWFLLRQTREKPLRATVCFSIEHVQVCHAPCDAFDVNFICQFMSVFHASVLLLMINCVITLSNGCGTTIHSGVMPGINVEKRCCKQSLVNFIQNDVSIVNSCSRFLIGYLRKSIKSHWLKS